MKRQFEERRFMKERSGKRYRIYLSVAVLSAVLLSGCGEMENGSGQDREEAGKVKVEAYEAPKIGNEMQKKVSAGENAYEITDGNLYGRGYNTKGQLGLGKTDAGEVCYTEPVLIAETVVHVDAFHDTVIFINEQKELYGFGESWYGQLGTPVDESVSGGYISIVTEPSLIADDVIYAELGAGFTMFLKEDGGLYMLGDNQNGQLGDGTAKPVRADRFITDAVLYSSEPVFVMDNVKYIAHGDYTAAAITGAGDLWIWGDNSFGEIGNGRKGNGLPSVSDDVVSKPYLVMKKVKSVRFDEHTVYASGSDDAVYAWGEEYSASPEKLEE